MTDTLGRMGAAAPSAGRGPAGGADFTAATGNALVALGALVATHLPSGANGRR
ncbi:hypothetical protein QMZ92_21565 [Streptomyces sp. HNM0645]|uniref:hypothetical protein n=1 Tax=Streptomyces sp. HNM0645 TaxID=2782343 RepID=UPI0024B719F5|nr:hypothetical protein [Streptomyces sp. HNM0645]MDI9886885.1 hypothetical protein [Streptomyces sp. HNM0645]